MKFTHYFAVLGLNIMTTVACAAPLTLMIHNQTDSESNAYISGVASPKPSKPHQDNSVPWALIKMACYGHTLPNGHCPAIIKMDTNTANPIDIGSVELDLTTGEIIPARISANGYTLYANGPAEGTITKD